MRETLKLLTFFVAVLCTALACGVWFGLVDGRPWIQAALADGWLLLVFAGTFGLLAEFERGRTHG